MSDNRYYSIWIKSCLRGVQFPIAHRRFLNDTISDLASRQVSLTTTPLSTTRASVATEETFLKTINSEMTKVEEFTLEKVTQLRQKLNSVEQLIRSIESSSNNMSETNESNGENEQRVIEVADEIAEDFLRIEKYVNINFMGFHKILKKHDKHLPNQPCKAFYISRMHNQAWVRGDYSDLVVRLSQVYSSIRHDHVAKESKDASQSFLRSTTKYWVKTEDVSRVKYAILKHLPVFLQKTSSGESDSQVRYGKGVRGITWMLQTYVMDLRRLRDLHLLFSVYQ